MPTYVYQLFLDRYAPDGTLRVQDEFIASNSGLYEFYGAKWIDHETHAVIGSGSINRTFDLYRKTDIASDRSALDSFTIGAQIMRGIAKTMGPDGKQEIYFLDTATNPDDLYRIRLDSDATPYAIAVGTGPNDSWGLCWMDHAWAYISAAGTTNNFIARARLMGTVITNTGTIVTRSPFSSRYLKGLAWNGRDVAAVSNNTTSPPTSYDLDLARPIVSHTTIRNLASRGSFPNEFAGAVDVDWNGREWLVYHQQKVDLGA